MNRQLSPRASRIVVYCFVGLAALFAAIGATAIFVTQDRASPAMAQLNRAERTAARTGNAEGVLAIVMDSSLDFYIRASAAKRLSDLMEHRPAERDALEAALVGERNAAAPPEASTMRHLLSVFNWRAIDARDMELVAQAQRIMGDANASLAPGRSGLPHLQTASVDAIFDFAAEETGGSSLRLSGSRWFGLHAASYIPSSPFAGLSRAEMAARAGELDTIALVRRWRSAVGQYTGGCTGTAYRAMASVYVVSLARRSVVGAREISGPDPPHTTVTIGRKIEGRPLRCDADGGKPTVKGVLTIKER